MVEPIGDKFVPLIENETTKDAEASREKKEMTKEMVLEKELNVVGEEEEDTVIGVELEEKKNRLRPPKMIALDSTSESITWQLSEPDPELKIDKYQVSCWDQLTTNHQRDLPCCLVESTRANLTVGRLEPNTSYTCQGG